MSSRLECLLHTALNDSAKDFLIPILKGICCVVEVPFLNKEYIFESSFADSSSELCVRCRLVETVSNASVEKDVSGWSVISYIPFKRVKLNAIIRTVIEANTSDNILKFMQNLGYRLKYEYMLEGKESLAIFNEKTFSLRMMKLKKSNASDIESSVSNSFLFEVCTSCMEKDLIQTVDCLNTFTELFSPVKFTNQIIQSHLRPQQPLPSTIPSLSSSSSSSSHHRPLPTNSTYKPPTLNK
jgi:hypothetical protein